MQTFFPRNNSLLSQWRGEMRVEVAWSEKVCVSVLGPPLRGVKMERLFLWLHFSSLLSLILRFKLSVLLRQEVKSLLYGSMGFVYKITWSQLCIQGSLKKSDLLSIMKWDMGNTGN